MKELRNLDWTEILSKLETYATSEAGRQILRATSALANPAEAQKSFAETLEAQAIVRDGQRCFMESLDLYALWLQRLSKEAVLKTLELKDVRHFCLEVIALKETLKVHETPWLKTLTGRLMEGSEPLSAIDQVMTPEGDIRTDASETLYRLFREKTNQVRAVQQILDKLVNQHELDPILQDRYVTNREGRWVLPVKSGMQHHFEGIIHASSQTKQTVYMEPKEIIPLNNRLRQIEVEIEDEIERLLAELSKYLLRQIPQFEASRDVLLECDVRLAQAQLATHLQAQPIHFSDAAIRLQSVKHPLLMLNNTDVISNNVQLDHERRILLLSGPNAGGKTVLLKAVGLAAHMARCGLLVCCEENSVLPFFEHVHVAVGDSQSVDAQLSTFAAHLRVLNDATKAKGTKHLLLVDEICGSTDPEEGTALARSFLETYAANQVFGVITSHLGPLKLGWTAQSGVINGSLEYDSQTGKPTYQFIMGVPGQSLALQTARRVGVAPEIIERAMSHMSPEMKQMQMGLGEIELAKNEIQQLKEDLMQQSREARQAKLKFQNLSQKFDQEKEKMLEQVLKRAERKVETLIDHSKVDDVFRRHQSLEKVKVQLPEIIKASTKANASPARLTTADEFAKAFPAGSKVFAPSLGRDAVVQGLPNARGEVPILSNSMRLMVLWDQLQPPHQARNPTMDLVRRTHDLVTSPLEGDRVIDLRGMAVEEAIRQLESQLDTAAVHSEDRLKIIHGHGTDALKRGVRNYLSRSVYVKKWNTGTAESGGDGVTWVELKD